MAAPTGTLLSLGHSNSKQQNAFIKQKALCEKKSINNPAMFQDRFPTMRQGRLREMHLQQQWQELKEREHIAQQHNRQLLQQFEEAQDTLKEMLARNAAMKTIRMEYERYLEENFPRWQQQLREKTQAAEKKRMEDYLSSYLKKTEQERMVKSTAGEPLFSQGPSLKTEKNIPHAHSTQEFSTYNQARSQYPDLQSWLTHTQSQSGRFPVRVPAQTHSPTILSQPNFPHPHPFIHHLASTGGHHHPQSRQDAAFWGPSEHSYPRPWAAGIPPGSWGQLCTEEPPLESRFWQTGTQEDEISRAPSSKRERGGGSSSSSSSSRLSPELDVKPVRLPSAHADSSESSSASSSQQKRKKKEKRGRTQHSSSDGERCGSQRSSRTSSEIVIAPVAVPQISVTETSTEEERTRSSRRSKRSEGLTAGSPRSEKAVKEETRNHNEESPSAGEESGSSSEDSMKEEAGNQSHDESCREEQESESNSVKDDNRFKDEPEKQQNSSSENSSAEENEEEREYIGAGDGENDRKEEENDDNEVSAKTNTTGEEMETAEEDEDDQGDDEEPNKLESKDAESRKQGSASSQDEDEDGSEGNESQIDEEEASNEGEDGESEEEEENRSEKEEEEEEENRDSEDSIISPQEKRSKQMQIIPEDEDDEEECKDGSSTNDSNEVSDEDDVENLLAPQDQSKKEEKNEKADEKPTAVCHVDIFQVTDVKPKTDQHSDSDEFDHFYD